MTENTEITNEEMSGDITIQQCYNEGIRLVLLALYSYCRTSGTPIYNGIRNLVVKDIIASYEANKDHLKDAYDRVPSKVQTTDDNSQAV